MIDRKLERRLQDLEELLADRVPDPALPAPEPTPAEIREARRALWQAAALTPEERTAYRAFWEAIEAETEEPWATVWQLFNRRTLTNEQRHAFAGYLRSLEDVAALHDAEAEDPSGPAALIDDCDRQALRALRMALHDACITIDDHTQELAESAFAKIRAAWQGLSREERRRIDHRDGEGSDGRFHDLYAWAFLGDDAPL